MKIRTLAALALVAACTAAPALAQTQDAASAAAPGQIDYTYNNSKPTPAAIQNSPLNAKGVKIRDMLLATPALRVRRGFALHTSVVLKKPVAERAGGPDIVTGNVLLRFVQVSRSKPNAKGEYPGDGEGPALLFWINDWKGLGSAEPGQPFTLADDVRTNGGVTTYTYNGYDFLMLHKPGNRPFRPMSMEEYYNFIIGEQSAVVAEAKAKGYTGYEKTVASVETMRAQLATLTAAERAGPACEVYSRKPAPCLSGNVRRIGVIEPGFFKGKPVPSAQVITVQIKQQPKRAVDFNNQLVPLRAAASQLDVAALQALLD